MSKKATVVVAATAALLGSLSTGARVLAAKPLHALEAEVDRWIAAQRAG